MGAFLWIAVGLSFAIGCFYALLWAAAYGVTRIAKAEIEAALADMWDVPEGANLDQHGGQQ